MQTRKLAVALDVDSIGEALRLVDHLQGEVDYFKVGLELLHSEGTPVVLGAMNAAGVEVMVDWKLHDIPETVERTVKTLLKHNVAYFNLHCTTGKGSMLAAIMNRGRSKVQGVTVLTSLDKEECIEIYGDETKVKVPQFAKVFAALGGHAIICSAQEARVLRETPELNDLELWTPGIRPDWAAAGDQKRVLSPHDAVVAGANVLIVGRPITRPPNEIGSPRDAARRIKEEMWSV